MQYFTAIRSADSNLILTRGNMVTFHNGNVPVVVVSKKIENMCRWLLYPCAGGCCILQSNSATLDEAAPESRLGIDAASSQHKNHCTRVTKS